MKEVFSDYVARLGSGGEPPDQESFTRVQRELEKALSRELRRRGLWDAPPAYLGISGASWWRGETLAELVQEAYCFNFVRRLRGLRNQSRLRTNIRGLIVRNIQNLLTDLQRKADPIGYTVFMRLRAALFRAIEIETLFFLGWERAEGDIGNETPFGFQKGLPPRDSKTDLVGVVRRWNDRILKPMIQAQTRAVAAVVEKLAGWVEDVRQAGVQAFRFREVVGPMKEDARRRWRDLFEREGELGTEGLDEDGAAIRVLVVRPCNEVDGPRRFADLLDRISAAIDSEPEAHGRRELWEIWRYLRSSGLEEKARPSLRKLEALLGISRQRLPRLLARLGEIVTVCRESSRV